MRILHVIPSIDPKQGGVAATIRVRGVRLVETGHCVEVATLDPPDSDVLASYPLPVHALGPAKSHWYYSNKLVPWLQTNINRFDAVIIDGIWQYHGVAVRRVAKAHRVPYFVIPHGMLGAWFKRTFPLKHAKKWVAWLLFDYWVLKDAQGVFYSCEEERVHAGRSFWLYRAKERIVFSGTSPAPDDEAASPAAFLEAHPDLAGKRLVAFVGRIHPIKGLDLLLHSFARVCRSQPSFQLVVAGPGDDDYVRQLKALAVELEIADRVSWLGMLDSTMKWAVLKCSEVLALPSHHENFGVVVAEALACGVPVLISNQVNIWQVVQDSQAGFVAADTVEGTVSSLNRWVALSESERLAMKQQAQLAFEEHFHVNHMAADMCNAIMTMIQPPR